MTKKERNLEKIIIVLLIIIAILLLLIIFQKMGVIENIQNTSKKLFSSGEMLISENGEIEKTVNSSNWDTSKVAKVTDSDGKEVPVPKGYVGSNATGENTVKGGYVIYEGTGVVNDSNVATARTSRNQWVWIPVPYPDRIYEEVNGVKKAKLYTFTLSGRSEYRNDNYEPAILSEFDTTTNLTNGGLAGMTPDKFYQELQKEFDSTIESIEKYGGFYIGRYETGNLSQSKPVVMQGNTDITNQTWYAMYSKMGYLAANPNVKTNMIWGCLWDETLQWLIERGNKSYVQLLHLSYQWGVYYEAYNKLYKTGSSDYVRALNIYDLAGNAWEYTLEGNGITGRVFRGGGYDISCNNVPVSGRYGCITGDYKAINEGCRAYLYIK